MQYRLKGDDGVSGLPGVKARLGDPRLAFIDLDTSRWGSLSYRSRNTLIHSQDAAASDLVGSLQLLDGSNRVAVWGSEIRRAQPTQ